MKPSWFMALDRHWDEQAGTAIWPFACGSADGTVGWYPGWRCLDCGERRHDGTGLCGICRFGAGYRARLREMGLDGTTPPEPNPIPIQERATRLAVVRAIGGGGGGW